MSSVSSWCQVVRPATGLECNNPATHFVSYFTDGSAGVSCCTQHLGRAVDLVLDTLPADNLGTAKVIRIGAKRPTA